jgi:hypothetical protein
VFLRPTPGCFRYASDWEAVEGRSRRPKLAPFLACEKWDFVHVPVLETEAVRPES